MSVVEEKEVWCGPIAGVAFGAYKLRPDRLVGRDLRVSPQPQNPHDPNAISLVAMDGLTARHVGYIPRKETHLLHAKLAEGRKLRARVIRIEVPQGRHYAHSNLDTPIVSVFTLVPWSRPTPKGPPVLRPAGTRRILS